MVSRLIPSIPAGNDFRKNEIVHQNGGTGGGGGEEAPVTSHECLGGTIKTSLIVDL